MTETSDTQPEVSVDDAAPVLAVERAFGVENRSRLLDAYFEARPDVTAATAWAHVYALLLWVDRTTGLAHCYESDKCQPGRPWYARSLAFHTWVAEALAVSVTELGDHIDLLFRWAAADLAAATAERRAALMIRADQQREPYASRELPQPGEDPELEAIIAESMRPFLSAAPDAETMRSLSERVRAHVGQENKRKNLVGEGFEDTMAALLDRIDGIGDSYEVMVRPRLQDVPGFRPPRAGSKGRQVDLVLVRRRDGRRTLVSCKWSVRSDREEQFSSDFRDYVELEDAGQDFDYVLVTNEFDPARLAAASTMRSTNAPLFTDVVHVNPDGPLAAYDASVGVTLRSGDNNGISRAKASIASGRLISMQAWVSQLQVR